MPCPFPPRVRTRTETPSDSTGPASRFPSHQARAAFPGARPPAAPDGARALPAGALLLSLLLLLSSLS